MKTIKYFLNLSFIALLTLFTSCNNDDDFSEIKSTETGKIQLKFENGFDNLGGIVLDQTTQTSSNGQKHKLTTLKYIISNITLIDEKGNEFDYHKNDPDKGAFVINQDSAIANVVYLNLDNIPQNKYTKIRFGLGVSQKAYLLGQTGQATFWEKAKKNGMTWAWAAGYVFFKIEGFYGKTTTDTFFLTHTGNMGDINKNNVQDLYKEVTLDLPTSARVTSKIKPSIHIMANLNTYLSGNHKLTLDESNNNIMGSSNFAQLVTENIQNMFRVDHVHNDEKNQ
ncbi:MULTISPECIES: MbnP family protein [unclassified Empedobacter]|uniref:MbnP family protein n=1 Tax=unclassified Empedobacter TaxID=2643773 RepID=UPI0025C06078|nr:MULTISPECIES: MbnP family protein [unclassified Empedobacter]